MTSYETGSPPARSETAGTRLRALGRQLSDEYVGRTELIRLLQLSVVSREHLLLVGPPGTAKTEIAHRFTEQIAKAQLFTYLLTRFTEPSELFGPLDIEQYREHKKYRVETAGMLPTAHIAFLDEVFEASSAILNTLLTVIQERIYHNGPERETARLISMIGATNRVPEDPALSAFADRFMLRARIEPVAATHLEDLLEAGWESERARIEASVDTGSQAAGRPVLPVLTLDDLVLLHQNMVRVNLSSVLPLYQQVIKELLQQGLPLSDRRAVRGLKLVAGAAVIRGESTASAQDLWPLLNLSTDPVHQELLEATVRPHIDEDLPTGSAQQRRSVESIVWAAQAVTERAKQVPGARLEVELPGLLRELTDLRSELRDSWPTEFGAADRLAELIEETVRLTAG